MFKEDITSVDATPEPVSVSIIGNLYSHVPFPVTVSYNGDKIRISPRATLEGMDRSMLPEILPLGIVFHPKQ